MEQAIFDAVHRMLERGSRLGDLTTDRIAQEAGVGKATLYRRWPNRDALLLDLVVRLDEQLPELPGRDIRQDLVALVDFMRRRGLAKRARGLLSLVLGEMAASPELYRMYRERVVVPRKQAVQDVLERGMAEGTIRADIDVRLLGELVMGPILIRALLDENAPLGDPELSEQIVDAALRGIAAAVPVRGK